MRLDKPKGINVQVTTKGSVYVQVGNKILKSSTFTVYDTTVEEVSEFLLNALKKEISKDV